MDTSVIKLLAIILVFAIGFLQLKLWFGHGGLIELTKLVKVVGQHEQSNLDLKTRNAVLAAEVFDLKVGLAAIEERARSELGMIRDQETFYQRLR